MTLTGIGIDLNRNPVTLTPKTNAGPNGEYVIVVDKNTLPSTAFVQTGDPDAIKNTWRYAIFSPCRPAPGVRPPASSVSSAIPAPGKSPAVADRLLDVLLR